VAPSHTCPGTRPGLDRARFGYLGAGVFNDGIVGVAPLFWAMLGLGIRIDVDGSCLFTY
jgi:hypothetical protein